MKSVLCREENGFFPSNVLYHDGGGYKASVIKCEMGGGGVNL